jgi:hypothetical protein
MTSVRDFETEIYRVLSRSGFVRCAEPTIQLDVVPKTVLFRHQNKGCLLKEFANVQDLFGWLKDLKAILSDDYLLTQFFFQLSSDSVQSFCDTGQCVWETKYRDNGSVSNFFQRLISDHFVDLVKVNGSDEVNDMYRWIGEHMII